MSQMKSEKFVVEFSSNEIEEFDLAVSRLVVRYGGMICSRVKPAFRNSGATSTPSSFARLEASRIMTPIALGDLF